jgi:hypothetical protein
VCVVVGLPRYLSEGEFADRALQREEERMWRGVKRSGEEWRMWRGVKRMWRGVKDVERSGGCEEEVESKIKGSGEEVERKRNKFST